MEDAELDRHIRSLNNGSQQLDNILAMGRTESIHWGLGYQGGSSYDREAPRHVYSDSGTGHSTNVKSLMAAREMKTHTSLGSPLIAKKLKDI
ncbi:unnamed protein product [Arabis nemorensis]|uniref:Uncharacterized protein n=1 Tax=Arabis nemorensis TaxID=586526 RepID=A0A565CNG7_9BRAS|nr:unnamed protein product [Arabis nemorensis]